MAILTVVGGVKPRIHSAGASGEETMSLSKKIACMATSLWGLRFFESAQGHPGGEGGATLGSGLPKQITSGVSWSSRSP